MKIGDEVFIHGYVDEIRKDTIIIRNEGGYFGTVESEIRQEPSNVKYAHWDHMGGTWKNKWRCSYCGYKLFDEQTNYCPNCGCVMKDLNEG